MKKIFILLSVLFLLSSCTPYNQVNQTIVQVANACLSEILTIDADREAFQSCLNSSAIIIGQDVLTVIGEVLQGYSESALKTISNVLTGEPIARSFDRDSVIDGILNSLE